MVDRLERYLVLCSLILTGCSVDSESHKSSESATRSGPDPVMLGELTERIESENFVFHYQPGDTVWVERQEAFHRWAVEYLDISIPEKIAYYKFRFSDMETAVGAGASGVGYPRDFAIATIYPWHAHETMHVYTYELCGHTTIRLFDEGMAIAHDVDPLENDWTAKWRVWPGQGDYVYSDKVREHRAARRLHPVTEIIVSRSFEEARARERGTVNNRVLYDQAGTFVSYLIDAYGIDKMKQAICSVTHSASRETILTRFEEVFGVSVLQAEQSWLERLDAR